jgi:hypothetical protein
MLLHYEWEAVLENTSLLFNTKNADRRADGHDFIVSRSLQMKAAFSYRNMKRVSLP